MFPFSKQFRAKIYFPDIIERSFIEHTNSCFRCLIRAPRTIYFQSECELFGEPVFLCAIWRSRSMLHLVMNVDDSKVYAHRFGSKIGINGLYIRFGSDRPTRVHSSPDLYNIAREDSSSRLLFSSKVKLVLQLFPIYYRLRLLPKDSQMLIHSSQHQGSEDKGLKSDIYHEVGK